MLYYFYAIFADWLNEHGLGFFRVLHQHYFRAIAALLTAFAIVILFAKPTIKWLLKQKIGDNPEFYNKDLNQLMKDKTNTPTMGGILICAAILISTLLFANLASFYIRMAIICLISLAILGTADDWLKLTSAVRSPGSREGLKSWEKFAFQLVIAVLLTIFIYRHGFNKEIANFSDTLVLQIKEMSHTLTLPFQKSWVYTNEQAWIPNPNAVKLSFAAFIFIGVITLTGFSNAVNLTDGMDGLATGITSVVAFALMILCFIAGDQKEAQTLLVPFIPDAQELAIVSGAIVGACLGFLWFNCNPAKIFMGDTGSLTLGGLLAYIAIVIRQEILLIIIGGIFVLEAASVIIQVGYFKYSGGKRVFKCAPIHHHFHLKGWTEQQIVVRFWLITAILAAIALGTIKLR